MAALDIDFQLLRDAGLSDIAEKILDTFESALASRSTGDPKESAKLVAHEIKSHISVDSDAELEDLWELYINLAKSVPRRHEGQNLLVMVAARLDAPDPVTGDQAWTGLPLLGRCLRDNWADPTFEVDDDASDDDEDESYTPDQWLNMNSFAARMFGAGLAGWINFPIWQLRLGLEETPNSAAFRDRQAMVSAEWIIQSGPELLRRSLLSPRLDLGEERSYCAGSLYTGLPGLGLERWGFWKRRLGELSGELGGAARACVDEAVLGMAAAEAAFANGRSTTENWVVVFPVQEKLAVEESAHPS
ncbi:hypothetical protein GQ53DRAFT_746765 [Thozetella sp. PMI_491]|nr:hypothetical protein GQ53DRAFT_746765 [Thozetella sp. PMI_491]